MQLIDWPEDGYLRWGPPGKQHKYNCLEALLITMCKLGSPGDLFDLRDFGLAMPRLSEATNALVRFLWVNYRYQLTDLQRWAFLFKESAAAFDARGMPFSHVHSMLDGKLYARKKPTDKDLEQECWNTHKHVNAENFQAFTSAHGIHIGFFGPCETAGARRHDALHFRLLGLQKQLEDAKQAAVILHGPGPWRCFADSAYPQSDVLQKKFLGRVSWQKRDFNHDCDTNRACAEWNFAAQCQQFPCVDTYRSMCMANMATALMTHASVMFHNWHVCCYGGLINSFFGVEPPSLERYFQV